MHDDRLGSSDPPLDLRDGEAGTGGSGLTPHSTSRLGDLPALSALGEVLVHVLSEVSEQRELLVERGGHLAAAHAGQVVALPKLDQPSGDREIERVNVGRGLYLLSAE